MSRLKIAVIGSGISGLSAAWLLSQRHQVTLHEADARLGGHANTIDVSTPDGPVAVDTGFIVYNEPNYPNLSALFGHLGVATRPTEMSFAFSLTNGAYEYCGSGAAGFFGQWRNAFSPRHWRLLRDLSRFFSTARETGAGDLTLGEYLARERYGEAFIDDHIVPMGSAIWSTDASRMLDFPAQSFIDFYANHGMLQFTDRPKWRTVAGGSRSYVAAMVADGAFEIAADSPVRRVVRHAGYAHVTDARGVSRPFDHVVMACHADQALRLLDTPDELETKLLSAFTYQANRAVLHRDRRWMPRRRRLWSSWNYLRSPSASGEDGGLCVTYWMNRLQDLPTETNLFVTLNPTAPIHAKAVDAEIAYRHPVFDRAAGAAQPHLASIQGRRRTWFCGSYFGYGFHEDGIQSGLAVAERLGGVRRPWSVAGESARIAPAMGHGREAAE